MRDVITLCEEWVAQHLLDASLPHVNDEVYPSRAPTGTPPPFVTHDIEYGEPALFSIERGAPTAFFMRWHVVTWNEGPGRQVLVPTWDAIFTALLGPGHAGLSELYESETDGSIWSVESRYYAPLALAALDVDESQGEWQRIGHQISLFLTPQ